jgi:Flp pilus assembly protein TadG
MSLRSLNALTLRLPRALRRLIGDRRGVSAVEFALLAPVMIGLYLGCVEISDAVGADRKVTLTASSLANLAAQVTTISQSDMTNILNAAGQIITPYSSSLLKSTVSCLKMDSTGKAKVQWSATRNGTALSVGSVYTFSSTNSALAVPNTSLILATVSYAYTPVVGYTITGTLVLSDQMFMSPRISAPDYNNGSTDYTCL